MLVGMSAGPGSAARPVLAGPGTYRRTPGRSAPLPRPAFAGAVLLLADVGLGATTALTITAETAGQLTAAGGFATFAGNLTGMVGTYLALMMVLLVSRIPVSERVLGQDGLLRWHRRLAPWPISLLVAHAVLITAGTRRRPGAACGTRRIPSCSVIRMSSSPRSGWP
jgi:hypothetical protein